MSPTFAPPPEPGEIDAAKAAELRTSRENVIAELEDLLDTGALLEASRERIVAILQDHEGTVVKLAATAIIEWAHGGPELPVPEAERCATVSFSANRPPARCPYRAGHRGPCPAMP